MDNIFSFEINNSNWVVKLISNTEMQQIGNDTDNEYFIHGLTRYSENIIYINKQSPEIIRSLIHELTHCWLYVYGHNQDDRIFNNEDLCEIMASSICCITKITTNFMDWQDKQEGEE